MEIFTGVAKNSFLEGELLRSIRPVHIVCVKMIAVKIGVS